MRGPGILVVDNYQFVEPMILREGHRWQILEECIGCRHRLTDDADSGRGLEFVDGFFSKPARSPFGIRSCRMKEVSRKGETHSAHTDISSAGNCPGSRLLFQTKSLPSRCMRCIHPSL